MERIYLDHAATSPTHPEVVEKMIPYMTETDWELGNRRVPQYLLRLMAYKIEIEKLADKKRENDKEDNAAKK